MIQRRVTPLSIFGGILALLLIFGCAQGTKTQGGKIVFMASTIGLIDSGIVDVLKNEFGKDKYGSPLFFPNAKGWKESQGKNN